MYLQAFLELKRARDYHGFGFGPIKWDTIRNYCIDNELDREQTDAMHYHIENMDDVYIAFHQKKGDK